MVGMVPAIVGMTLSIAEIILSIGKMILQIAEMISSITKMIDPIDETISPIVEGIGTMAKTVPAITRIVSTVFIRSRRIVPHELHRFSIFGVKQKACQYGKPLSFLMVASRGVEPPTNGLGNHCSVL